MVGVACFRRCHLSVTVVGRVRYTHACHHSTLHNKHVSGGVRIELPIRRFADICIMLLSVADRGFCEEGSSEEDLYFSLFFSPLFCPLSSLSFLYFSIPPYSLFLPSSYPYCPINLFVLFLPFSSFLAFPLSSPRSASKSS